MFLKNELIHNKNSGSSTVKERFTEEPNGVCFSKNKGIHKKWILYVSVRMFTVWKSGVEQLVTVLAFLSQVFSFHRVGQK